MANSVKHLGQRSGLIQSTTEERPVTNSSTVADGDFVELASGRVAATDGTGRLYGVVKGGSNDDLVSRNYRTPSTTGNASGSKKVLVELCEGQRYELPVSASLASDAEGSYYDIGGSQGSQVVNNATKSATEGQLQCIERIPTNAAGTEFERGVFVVAERSGDAVPA